MSTISSRRDFGEIGLADHLLTTVGSCLAVFSAGMAVGMPDIGLFMTAMVVAGGVVSYFIRLAGKGSNLMAIDGIIYAGAIAAAIIAGPSLNSRLPGGGFPREVLVSGTLSWMLALGSYCTWRDGTLLFQAIPAFALFGLVGCYDTFRNVTFAFFGFLICLAILFARAHTREMLQQAADSGYFLRTDSAAGGSVAERKAAQVENIREGPWRWLAGPEWALASAMFVIFASLFGAPVIQRSTLALSGTITAAAPPIRRASEQSPILGNTSSAEARIGQGAAKSNSAVFEATLDQPRYLRVATYDSYTGDGWRSTLSGIPRDQTSFLVWPDVAARQQIDQGQTIDFTIRPLTLTRNLPVPGELLSFAPSPNLVWKPDGTIGMANGVDKTAFSGKSLIAPDSVSLSEAVTQIPSTLIETASSAGISDAIRNLAKAVTSGGGSDYNRANLIKAEIERRCLYNINASPPPANKDVTESFLFSQKEGYCDSFASAMVLMARSVGIPARYVTGYLPNEQNRDDAGRYIIVERDAHAWAELFFKGAGWVVFDATEGAKVAPGGLPQDVPDTPWYKAPGFVHGLDVVLGIALLVGIGLFLRSLKPTHSPAPERSAIERLYMRFSDVLQRKSGRRRISSQTPFEFLELARPSLGDTYTRTKELNETFVRLLYGPATVVAKDVAKMRSDLRDWEKLLRSERTPRK